MSTVTESLLLDCGATGAAQAATEVMTRRGLQVMRSFDLRTARRAQGDCLCPYHGTADCTCQFVVLLVYDGAGAPAVLTLDSQDVQARVRIVRDTYNRAQAGLVEQILAALLEAAPAAHAASEPLPEMSADAN